MRQILHKWDCKDAGEMSLQAYPAEGMVCGGAEREQHAQWPGAKRELYTLGKTSEL